MNLLNVAMHYMMILCYIVIIIFMTVKVKGFKYRKPIHGLYTRDIKFYQLLVPYRIDLNGEIESFNLPQYYKHDYQLRRRKRDILNPDLVNYNLYFDGKDHHIQLWPNHGFISPDVISEYHYPGSDMNIKNRKLKRFDSSKVCHYTGRIKDDDRSSVALSLCDGLAGFLRTSDGTYFIEPVKDFGPNEYGHHLHVIHKDDTNHQLSKRNTNKQGFPSRNCGVEDLNNHGWSKAFENYFEQNENLSLLDHIENRRDISLNPLHKYLEVLVVADKKFLDFHKDNDYENYIMTVMNMVSDYFHDATLSNQYDITIVRIVYLDENIPAIDLNGRSNNVSSVLRSFCKWQYEINPKDIEHPQHHDIALLITRHDICSMEENENCDLLGFAYLASACMPSDACAINEDKGLILGVVIAHEIGHIMGCEHDTEDVSGCPAMVDDKFYHVMSPYITLATTLWSSCSKTYMKELLKNHLGDCLNDEPLESPYKFDEILPGIIYDADYQCNLIFPNSTNCNLVSDPFCEKLFCKISKKKCWTNNEPPAEGTKCGANKWCSKQKCVPIGQRLHAINGGWTDWSGYSTCSRSCGGGIKVSERSCTKPAPLNGGLYCQGPNKRYKICNKKKCPDEVPSFRSLQCSNFNNIPDNGKFHKWIPYFPKDGSLENTCVLYCINEENVFTKLAPRTKDGTPCRGGTNDMCIAGVCRKVGCDWEFDSDAVNDHCGVCNGDDSGCTKMYGSYTMGGEGYSLMVTIPRGARNVKVIEDKLSDNSLAISNKKGECYLGPNEKDGEKRLGKNLGFYMHSIKDREELYIAGPLQEALVVYVVFNEPNNVGFSWEYYIRDTKYSPNSKKKKNNYYRWEYIDWTACSARCDGGIMKSEPHCIGTSPAGVVGSKFCSNTTKPETKVRVCNKRPCKVRWRIGSWNICSGCKHKPGIQFRRVWCGKESPHWDENDIITDDEQCIKIKGPKPKTKQLCTTNCSGKCKRRREYRNAVNKHNNSSIGGYEGNWRANNSFDNKTNNKLDNKFFQNYYKRIDFIDLDKDKLIFGTEQKWSNFDLPDKRLRELEVIDLRNHRHFKEFPQNQKYRNQYEKGKHKRFLNHNSLMNRHPFQDNYNLILNYRIPEFRSKVHTLKKRKNNENERNSQSSIIIEPKHRVISDFNSRKFIIETPYIDVKMNNLTDEGYQKYGDKVYGTIDLYHHSKIFKNKNKICNRMNQLMNTSDKNDNDDDDEVIEQSPTDNVDIPDSD